MGNIRGSKKDKTEKREFWWSTTSQLTLVYAAVIIYCLTVSNSLHRSMHVTLFLHFGHWFATTFLLCRGRPMKLAIDTFPCWG